jgi:hypothetical protein
MVPDWMVPDWTVPDWMVPGWRAPVLSVTVGGSTPDKMAPGVGGVDPQAKVVPVRVGPNWA